MDLHVFVGGPAHNLSEGAGQFVTGKDTKTGCDRAHRRSRLGSYNSLVSLLQNNAGGVERIHLPLVFKSDTYNTLGIVLFHFTPG